MGKRRRRGPPLSEQFLGLISEEGKALALEDLTPQQLWDRLSPEDRQLIRWSGEAAEVELREHQDRLLEWMRVHSPEVYYQHHPPEDLHGSD